MMRIATRRIVTSKPRGFLPTDILGLKLWLRADAGLYQDAAKTTPATTDGDVVGAWVDQSGNGNDATQATTSRKPLLKTNIVNGKPVVRFDGVDDYLDSTLSAISGNSPRSYFIVTLNLSGSGYRHLLHCGTSLPQQAHGIVYSVLQAPGPVGPYLGTHLWSYGWSTGFDIRGLTAISVLVFDGSAGRYYVNGQVKGTRSGELTTGASETYKIMSRIAPPVECGWGDVSEILICSVALSVADRQSVETYLNGKYNVY